MKAVELRRLEIPLVSPFRTSFGTQTSRDVLLVRVETADAEGWGECVAMRDPLYSSEYTDAAQHVLETYLLPALFAAGPIEAADVAGILEPFKGHRMAKAAAEMAVLDAELRAAGRPMAAAFGGATSRVPCGVSVGIADSIGALLDTVAAYLEQGYVRIKLKIEPGWDTGPVAAVRERFGDIPLQVDANAAYTLADAAQLAALDPFDLLLLEQPFPEEQLVAHARLAELVKTPVCLDESIVSAQVAADALALGACSIVNIKAGRVGGYLEAVRIHDLCRAAGIAVWCGGMLETGLGRAANVALASLPGFTLPGDVSASDRFFAQDIITGPFAMESGHLDVPTGPGLGVEVDGDVLGAMTTAVRTLTPGRQPG